MSLYKKIIVQMGETPEEADLIFRSMRDAVGRSMGSLLPYAFQREVLKAKSRLENPEYRESVKEDVSRGN